MANKTPVSHYLMVQRKTIFKGFTTVYNPWFQEEKTQEVLDEIDLQINHYRQWIPHIDADTD